MVSKWFLRAGVLFALAGMGLGIFMAASQDHILAPVHAHINLLGWVTMFLAGLFYALRPERQTRMAVAHLFLSITGLVILTPGLVGVLEGYSWGDPIAGIGSVLTLLAAVLFAFIVFSATANQPN